MKEKREEDIEFADTIIQRIQNTKVILQDGVKIPLGELASISLIVSDWKKYKKEVK